MMPTSALDVPSETIIIERKAMVSWQWVFAALWNANLRVQPTSVLLLPVITISET